MFLSQYLKTILLLVFVPFMLPQTTSLEEIYGTNFLLYNRTIIFVGAFWVTSTLSLEHMNIEVIMLLLEFQWRISDTGLNPTNLSTFQLEAHFSLGLIEEEVLSTLKKG